MISETVITAIGTLLAAVAGLVTALHAHSKSTQANTVADASHNYVKALYDISALLIPLFIKHTRPVTPPVVPGTVSSAPAPIDPTSEILVELMDWLRQQHTQTTGQSVGGPATTDFSIVLGKISELAREAATK